MEENSPRLMKLWLKSPLLIRAILLGFIISTVGVLLWSAIATFIPLPIALPLMIVLLFVYWKYFSGSWWQKNTQEFRKANFRYTKLPGKALVVGLVAALFIIVIEQSGLVITFRLIEFPAERFTSEYSFLNEVPVWAAWSVIIMISLVAGICEEIGFRGYMQVPLEGKYGPVIGISIVSIVFVLVHLHQAWSGPILIQVFFISVLFGTIAYFSGSLIPGIIAHFFMDICNFSFWWSNIAWQFDKETVAVTGIDNHFFIWIAVFIMSILGFIYTISKLKKMNLNGKNHRKL